MQISRLRYERTMVIATIVCEFLAYLLAMFCRYVLLSPFYSNMDRFYSFYRVFAGVVIAVRVLILYFYLRNEERTPVFKMESVEIVASAIKQHFILLVILALFLYFSRWSAEVSRTVMGLLILFGIILDIVWKKVYCNAYQRNYSGNEEKLRVVLVACDKEKEYLRHVIEAYGTANKSKDLYSDCLVSKVIMPEETDLKLPAISGEQNSTVYISHLAYEKLSDKSRKILQSLSIPVMYELSFNNKCINDEMIQSTGRTAVLTEDHMNRKCDVLGVKFTVSGLHDAVRHICDNRENLAGQYVCFSNVHTTVTAYEDPGYKTILNDAAYVMPDGSPIAKRIVASGFLDAERVAGPDFMEQMFRYTATTDISHYFYGSTEETIEKLKTELSHKYPGIKIAGMYSPPFRELTCEEDAAVVEAINNSGASLVWIGLGAPKQEKWMAAHKGAINGVMFGVGAGFDFHAGTAKRAPLLMQKLGMEWFYRLITNPRRLFKRYFVTNTKFLWLTRKPAEQQK